MEGCIKKQLTLEYPKHLCSPEDILHFIESTEFSAAWDGLSLDLEDDLTSLQMCLMVYPGGDCEIEGTGGLLKHQHTFGDWSSRKEDVTAYYVHFQEYGIVYLVFLDEDSGDWDFSNSQKSVIRKSINEVEKEIKRLQTIR